ncbi:MAG: hypothetical protein EA379_08050 [Phycisphaerales bacterium]|nr:MAG: hypothetical protein EA379_08050 [Phycisphaerales bacterium]
MHKDTKIQLLAAGVLAIALGVSALLTTAVSAEAGRAQLGYADRIEDSDPPEVAVGIALGAFRGLFVNMLWMRANSLKEEGKFYESIELARTITRLQPHFPRVWAFQAWNMAYNISVATKTAEERWMWVKAGVDLLRREGIPRNPNDMQLHRELAWIFNHKIQGYADDANMYYKRRHAEEWTVALGAPPPRAATTEASTERYVRWLRNIAASPDTLAEAIRREPGVETLVRRIRDEVRLPLDANLLRAVEIHLALTDSWAAREGLVTLSEETRNDALMRLLTDDDLTEAWRMLLGHLRKRLVIDEYKMEFPRMIRYTRKYGPLDWRHPSSHALYWTLRGVEEGLARINISDWDQTNTDRLALQSVQELARFGDLQYSILDDTYSAMPSSDFIPVYGELLEELLERAAFFERQDRAFTLYALGYQNFLRDTVRFYYRSGDYELAEQYYERLRTWHGRNIDDPDFDLEQFTKPIAQFIQDDLEDRLISPNVALQEFDGAMRAGFQRGLLRGRRDVFDANARHARAVHEYYMAEQLRRTTIDPDAERMELFPRVFEDAAARSLVSLALGGQLGPEAVATIYRRAPLWLQQPAYDALVGALAGVSPAELDDSDPQGAAIARLFPEPPNMAEYRQLRRAQRDTDDRSRQEGVRTEQQ